MGIGGAPYSKLEQLGGKSRRQLKQEARAEDIRQMKACYKAVDARDGGRCRVCRTRGNPNAMTLLERLHHHHLVYRSRGGQHETDSVLLLCGDCHEAIHVTATLRLEGDADARDVVTGRLAGVQVSRYTEAGWQVEKYC